MISPWHWPKALIFSSSHVCAFSLVPFKAGRLSLNTFCQSIYKIHICCHKWEPPQYWNYLQIQRNDYIHHNIHLHTYIWHCTHANKDQNRNTFWKLSGEKNPINKRNWELIWEFGKRLQIFWVALTNKTEDSYKWRFKMQNLILLPYTQKKG